MNVLLHGGVALWKQTDRISSINETGAERGGSMKLKVTMITSVWDFRNLFKHTFYLNNS
jgi:hypothetical protein